MPEEAIMKILNLTQHNASEEQVQAGVVEPIDKEAVKLLLTFDNLPTKEEVDDRARALSSIALNWRNCQLTRLLNMSVESAYQHVPSGMTEMEVAEWMYDNSAIMIGGAPYLMEPLVVALRAFGLRPVYAYSERVSVETEDGVKTSVFKHKGFV